MIQAQLGHRSPAVTTSRSLHRPALEALVEAIRERPAWSDQREPVYLFSRFLVMNAELVVAD